MKIYSSLILYSLSFLLWLLSLLDARQCITFQTDYYSLLNYKWGNAVFYDVFKFVQVSYVVKLHHHCLLQQPYRSASVFLYSLGFSNVAFIKNQNKTPAFFSIKYFHWHDFSKILYNYILMFIPRKSCKVKPVHCSCWGTVSKSERSRKC